MGGIIIFVTSITNVLVLGVNYAESLYHPSYTTVARVNMGNKLQIMEDIVAIIFILGGVVKLSIFLLSSCKGLTKVFEYNDYRFLVIRISLFINGTSAIFIQFFGNSAQIYP